MTEPVSVLDLVPAVAELPRTPAARQLPGPRRHPRLPATAPRAGRFLFTIQGITQEDALLEDDWKLLLNHDRRERALFDLATDPGERPNLAATEPARLAVLQRRLDALLTDQLAYYRDRGWESGWYPPKLP